MKKTLGILTLIFLSFFGNSQSNPAFHSQDIKAGKTYKFDLYSLALPTNVNDPNLICDSLSFESKGNNLYEVTLQVQNGQFGDLELIFEYFAIGDIPGIPYPFYSTYQFRTYPSEILTEDDVIVLGSGVGQVYPLFNDESSDGTLSLSHIAYTVNCTAEIRDSISIEVEIDDLTKEAYIVYQTIDSLNTVNEGKIVLISNSIESSYNLSLHNKQSKDIFLTSGFSLVDSPSQGSISEVVPNCWRYIPNISFAGQDSIIFSNGQEDLIYYASVYDKSLNVQFVRDDETHVAPGGSVVFNVLENDLLNFLPVIDYSPELTYLGSGEFQYDANDPNFSGDLQLFYKVFNGFIFVTGNIVIHVDHFSPNSANIEYSFSNLSNRELVIQHISPMTEYSITLLTPPLEGTVTIIDDFYIGECDSTAVLNSVLYQPNGFVGSDLFEVEYCTTADFCEIVKIEVINNESNLDDCACLDDCIWEGDVNEDGIVSSLDILELAYNIGEYGQSRESDSLWIAHNTNHWNYNQYGSDRDLSKSDVNGDGFIDSDDFSRLYDNYGKIHNLLPQQAFNILTTPVNLVPSASEVDSGDMIVFYISVGDTQNPIFDFSGLSFNFAIDPGLIDSSSLYVNFYDNGWAGYAHPSLGYYNQASEGNIDLVFSNIGGGGNSGQGIIAELGFIVEDDVDGLRLGDNYYDIPVTFRNGVLLNSFGEKFSLPESTGYTRLNIDESNDEDIYADTNAISIGPNPVSNTLSIKSSIEAIIDIRVVDVNGRLLISTPALNTHVHQLDFSSLQTGTYFVEIVTETTQTTKKIVRL